MDTALFSEWLGEPRIFKPLPDGRIRILYVDNCSAHKMTPQVIGALEKSRTELKFFPECATDLVQPADSFVIQAIKSEWKKRWNEEVMKRIANKIMAAEVVRDVSNRRDNDSVLFVRKAMIRCGLGLNLNGPWEEKQLSSELQEIIKKYPDNFDGAPATTDHDLDGEATDRDHDQ
eukprot:IDg10691t1